MQLAPRLRVALAVLAVIVIATIWRLTATPASYQTLSIRNQTSYDVDVAVSSDGREWLGLGTVAHHHTTVLRDVADQGKTWRFQFRSQGEEAGQTTVGRRQLVADGWALDIPLRVESDLRARGVPLPPQ